YFDSYSHFGIHEEMLKDSVRTKAYQDAIRGNAHLIRGKVVLDVGCGTEGILSMFAAQAGAKHVYAVDSSKMAENAKQIIEANGFQDVITVIQGKVEEIDLPVEKVDVIVSEWMGYCLLFEAMFDSIIYARDRWLRDGGMLLPDKAELYIAAIEDAKYKEDKIHFWENVYGFNMSLMKRVAMFEPLVDTVHPDHICTSIRPLWNVDLLTAQKSDMQVDAPFELQAIRNDYVHALLIFFEVGFTQGHKPLWLSTGPHHKSTHWHQTVLYLNDVLTIAKDELIQGHIKIFPSSTSKRHLDFSLNYQFDGEVTLISSQLAPEFIDRLSMDSPTKRSTRRSHIG
ncbi:hypothetical protein GUITHDRAFT_83399, partial [Guillardia theta CCMP2712]